MCQISIKYNMDQELFNLSSVNDLNVTSTTTTTTTTTNRDHYKSAFNIPYLSDYCPICSTRIIFDGPFIHLTAYVHFEGRDIEYYRCVDCTIKDKLLCRTSFLEKSVCRSVYENKLRNILMCIPFLIEWLNTDVMSYIMNIVSLCLLPCEGCQCYY